MVLPYFIRAKMNKDLKVLSYIYGVRIYCAIITIVLIPYVIKFVGVEEYGLIGFYLVLQACLSILDVGIGGVLTRQSIISSTDRDTYNEFSIIYKKVILFFLFVATLIFLFGYVFSESMIINWLQTNISHKRLTLCVELMIAIFVVRYVQSPFRSILLANECQLTLSTITLVSMTISQPLAVVALYYIEPTVEIYFIMQLASSFIMTVSMVVFSEMTRRKLLARLPLCHENDKAKADSMGKMIVFAFQLSFLSILWIIVNQSDKLALTRFMGLSDYAKYSIAVSVSGILTILMDPINQYLQPKLTRLYYKKEFEQYTLLLNNIYFFVSALTIPLCVYFYYYSDQIIYTWSGDMRLSYEVSRYLPWLFIGSVCSIFSNITFLLLYSFGKLKIHTAVYFLFSLVIIPMNIYIASKFKGEGVSLIYAFSSLLFFLAWTGFNLNLYFNKGISLIVIYCIPALSISVFYFYLSRLFYFYSDNRFILFLENISIGMLGFLIVFFVLLIIRKKSTPITFKSVY